jgi:hypothetical protein
MTFNILHSVIFQKIELFINIIVRIENPTYFKAVLEIERILMYVLSKILIVILQEEHLWNSYLSLNFYKIKFYSKKNTLKT